MFKNTLSVLSALLIIGHWKLKFLVAKIVRPISRLSHKKILSGFLFLTRKRIYAKINCYSHVERKLSKNIVPGRGVNAKNSKLREIGGECVALHLGKIYPQAKILHKFKAFTAILSKFCVLRVPLT